jgi:ABC-type Zn2+ transport system substrate-binding protein/surface adhesin
VLDPEGGAREAGPDAYFELMRANAAALVSCLGRQL